MASESKLKDPPESDPAKPPEGHAGPPAPAAEDDASSAGDEEVPTVDGAADGGTAAKKKKKKPKKKKNKDADAGAHMSDEQLRAVLAQNPALRSELEDEAAKASFSSAGAEVAGKGKEVADTKGKGKAKPAVSVEELLRKLSGSDMLAGLAPGGKNAKDMASYKFWQTQPVPRFDDRGPLAEGEIKRVEVDKVERVPPEMYPGFEWVTVDLEDTEELAEVYELLSNHYVEDNEAMFRFKYSPEFLNWALKAPGWKKDWHIGVRATASHKLVAFVSAIPVSLRVRGATVRCSEINYLVVHKKLRGKRLAPVLIKEVTRVSHLNGIFQGLYSAGVIIPKPIATCRYFHRSLDWEKLYDVGFSPLPPDSTKARQIARFRLPEKTATHGLRELRRADCEKARALLTRYLGRFAMALEFTAEEFEHWFLHEESPPPGDGAGAEARKPERVVYTYVVEDAATGRLTDLVSYYALASSAIKSTKHDTVNAAYLFYYATERAWEGDDGAGAGGGVSRELKARLNALVHDALILAKNNGFDVFNALTLLDNPVFLEQQRFGPGDGQLHFYLFNYRTAPLPGGVDEQNRASEREMGGVGVVML